MDFKKLSYDRYSVRSYLSKDVEKEKIEYILECARVAPSAANNQPWLFLAVISEEGKKAISTVYTREWFKTAPAYLIVCVDRNQSWKRNNTDRKDHCDIDGAIAAEHICLAAHSIGLGTCWICNFDPIALNKVLDLPENIDPIVIFTIGYIDTDKSKMPEKNRKPLSETTKWL